MLPSVPKRHRQISARVKDLANQRVKAVQSDLTFKSSVDNACLAAGLDPYAIDLPPKQRSWRAVYASKDFQAWVSQVLPREAVTDSEADPASSQVEGLRFGFCYGSPRRRHADIRWLSPHADGVWELKTPDVRLFGWFPEKDYLVLHLGEMKSRLKAYDDYVPYIQGVINLRSSIAPWLKNHVVGGLISVVSDRR